MPKMQTDSVKRALPQKQVPSSALSELGWDSQQETWKGKMTWKLEQVPEFFGRLSDIAKDRNFLLTAYGSTLKNGFGNDLDLIAMPYRENFEVENFLQILMNESGLHPFYVEKSELEHRIYFNLPDGRVVDLRVVL
jgi:hypothetical protein